MNNGLPTTNAEDAANEAPKQSPLMATLEAMGRLKAKNEELEGKLITMGKVVMEHAKLIAMLNDAFKIACLDQPGPLKDYFDSQNKEQRDAANTEEEEEHTVKADSEPAEVAAEDGGPPADSQPVFAPVEGSEEDSEEPEEVEDDPEAAEGEEDVHEETTTTESES